MRPLVVFVVVSGCGSAGSTYEPWDASEPMDATLATDAAFDAGDAKADVPAPITFVACDAGYFIEVSDDAGTTILRHGLSNGVPWETMIPGLGEDCWVMGIAGEDDSGLYSFGLGPAACTAPPLSVGSLQAQGEQTNTSGYWFGFGTMDVIGVTDAAVTGDYAVTFQLNGDDAGKPVTNGPTRAAHGTFCVLPP